MYFYSFHRMNKIVRFLIYFFTSSFLLSFWDTPSSNTLVTLYNIDTSAGVILLCHTVICRLQFESKAASWKPFQQQSGKSLNLQVGPRDKQILWRPQQIQLHQDTRNLLWKWVSLTKMTLPQKIPQAKPLHDASTPFNKVQLKELQKVQVTNFLIEIKLWFALKHNTVEILVIPRVLLCCYS